MQLSASSIYQLFRPSRCDLRPWLSIHGVPSAEPGPYEQVLMRLGQRHETDHLAQLGSYADLQEGSLVERAEKTIAAVGLKERILYQPVFIATVELGNDTVEVVGIPDFLIHDGEGYRIRDAKLSLHADENNHPEILLQVQLYGYLFERTFGVPPEGLEVLLGDSTIVEVLHDSGAQALTLLSEIKINSTESNKPYEPVGWSKCQSCGYRKTCWTEAEENCDVALVYGVDQGLARALHDVGVTTINQFVDEFTDDALSRFVRPWGKAERRVGKSAGQILQQARAMVDGREIQLGVPQIPDAKNFVMFDLEGLPPQMDELDKVYLWGTQIFGKQPGHYQAAVAGFGPEGDRQGWFDFLNQADAIFDAFGDIPFVHWHHYETTKLKSYIDRHGDPDGIAARVVTNCLDLLPVTRRAIVLPEPSYSLKVVERRVGYKRQLKEYGGDWSIARYIEATETGNESEQQAIMEEILAYNREDLEATWAVLMWLKSL